MRRGSIFVGVLIAAVVLVLGAFAFHFFMRHARVSAYRSFHGEQAAALARAGLGLTQVHLARALADVKSDLRRRLVAPLAELRGRGLVEVDSVDLAARFPEAVRALARDLPRGVASVGDLEARFGFDGADLAPLPDLILGDRTLPRGEREKLGRLFIECTARVSTGGLLGSVSRTARAYHEFRVAAAPVPLLSDFTLYSARGAGADLNTRAAGGEGLTLDNGVAGARAEIAGRLDAKFLAQQGWVHLGGDSTLLNLADGAENFQFFLGRGNARSGRSYVDQTAAPRANAHLPRPFWEIRAWDAGMPAPAGDIFSQDYRASALRLCGEGERVSPTVVFGAVQAGFLRTAAAAAARGANGAFDAFFAVLKDRPLAALRKELEPHLGRLMYLWDPNLSGKFACVDPTRVNAVLEPGKEVSEADYKALASGHRRRNYNQGLLHLKASNAEPAPLTRASELGLPRGLFEDEASATDRAALPGALLPAPWAKALDGLDLGRLALAELAPQLAKVCCWNVPAGTAYRSFLESRGMLEDGRLLLDTSVRGAGKLELPAFTEVHGGVLMADEIVITGSLPKPTSGVLVLIATKSIRVAAGVEVNASLISLGSVAFDGPASITGNVVGERVDLAPLTGPGAALAYDTRMKQRPFGSDPTDTLIVDFSRRPTHVE